MKQLKIVAFIMLCTTALFSDESTDLAKEKNVSRLKQFVYLSSNNLEVYKINDEGTLALIQNVSLKRSPAVSVVSPDGNFLYVVLFGSNKGNLKSQIITYAISDKGLLEEKARVDTHRNVFISVDPQGEYLFGAGNGLVAAYKLDKGLCNSPHISSAAADKGIHSVRMDGEFVYIPHIITNQMYQYKFDRKSEKFVALKPLSVSGPDNTKKYHDPRHLYFHSKLRVLYTSNEYGGGISSWRRNVDDGSLTLWDTKSTHPKDHDFFADPKNPDRMCYRASDIHLSPDNLFAYVANRDNSDRKSLTGKDTISIFALDPKTGALSDLISSVPTGRHVRSLLIDSSGQYLYATGVWSSTIHVYRRNLETGALKLETIMPCAESPMWMSLHSVAK